MVRKEHIIKTKITPTPKGRGPDPSKEGVGKQPDLKIDAQGKILGRIAIEAANALRGKDTPKFLPYINPGRKVVIFNTNGLSLTTKKLENKIYYRHSGYPGGIKEEPLARVMKRDSRIVVRRAVYGMLPKNRLRDRLITNLILYKGESKDK